MGYFEYYINALGAILIVAFATWLLSVYKRDVSIVDSLWPLFFLICVFLFAEDVNTISIRGYIVILLVTIWSLRLSIYLTARNWGDKEDHRYQTFRKKNEPNFILKSLFIVFIFQGLMAWIISIPLLFAVRSSNPLLWLDYLAIIFWLIGMTFESVGDYQLSKFRSLPANKARVCNIGLWKYSRHPNYFGEVCIWWSYCFFSMSSGAWWIVYSVILMTFLIIKVTGIAKIENTITERKPDYVNYISSTNAFFPGKHK